MDVLVTGSTGFIGRHVVPVLMGAGHRVVCLHKPSSDLSVLPEGVELRVGDVRDLTSLREASSGCDAVVHLVGIIRERESTFEEVNVHGVRNLLEACGEGEPLLVHVGALGTRENSRSRYARSKAEAEVLVARSRLRHAILRPSLVLGPGGDFALRFVSLVSRYRRVPVVGDGATQIQPIHVLDVTRAVAATLAGRGEGRVWPLVGAERVSWNDLVERTASVMGLRRSVRHIPAGLARVASGLSSLFRSEELITRDELILMREDLVGDVDPFIELVGDEPLGLDQCLRASIPPA